MLSWVRHPLPLEAGAASVSHQPSLRSTPALYYTVVGTSHMNARITCTATPKKQHNISLPHLGSCLPTRASARTTLNSSLLKASAPSHVLGSSACCSCVHAKNSFFTIRLHSSRNLSGFPFQSKLTRTSNHSYNVKEQSFHTSLRKEVSPGSQPHPYGNARHLALACCWAT